MRPVTTLRSFDWATFVDRYWDKRPVLFRARSFDPSHVFDAACEASRTYLEHTHSLDEQPLLQFTVGRMQNVFLEPWLPRPTDGSLDGYQARLAARLGQKRYALVVGHFHSFGVPLWLEQRALFTGLWERIGLPITGAITTLFHGNYEHSPVGVHLDRFSTFMFVVKGRKRMRLWRSCPWSGPMTTCLDYAPYLDTSTVVDVEEGDVLYWPSRYFHVGESAGKEPSTSVNIGVPRTGQRAAYYVGDILMTREAVEGGAIASVERLAPSGGSALVPWLHGAARLDRELPEAMRLGLASLRNATERRSTAAHLRALTLDRASAGGFEPPPPMASPRRLADRDRVRVDPRSRILWSSDASGAFWSANGHHERVAGTPAALAPFFDALRSRDEQRVGDLVGLFPRSSPRWRATGRHVLERLESAHALTRAHP